VPRRFYDSLTVDFSAARKIRLADFSAWAETAAEFTQHPADFAAPSAVFASYLKQKRRRR